MYNRRTGALLKMCFTESLDRPRLTRLYRQTAMPTIGAFSLLPPIEPKNGRS